MPDAISLKRRMLRARIATIGLQLSRAVPDAMDVHTKLPRLNIFSPPHAAMKGEVFAPSYLAQIMIANALTFDHRLDATLL